MVLGTDTRYLGHSAWYISSTLLNREPEHTARSALCLLLCLRLSKQRSALRSKAAAPRAAAPPSLSLSFLSFSLLGLYLTCTYHLLLDTQRTILPQGVCVLSCARTRCILVLSTCCMHHDQSTLHLGASHLGTCSEIPRDTRYPGISGVYDTRLSCEHVLCMHSHSRLDKYVCIHYA